MAFFLFLFLSVCLSLVLSSLLLIRVPQSPFFLSNCTSLTSIFSFPPFLPPSISSPHLLSLYRSLLFPPGSVYIPANLSLLSLSFFLLSRSQSPILSQSISADAFFLSIASNISSNCPFSLCLCRPKNARPNMELSHKSIDRNSSAMECSTQSPCINILFKTDTNVPCSCVVE